MQKAAYFCGLSDPILWRSVAFLLNYIPILGPLCGVAILCLAGLLTFDPFIEGESVTPMLLARCFILNPALVIAALMFWHWMWRVGGTLLAVPMLATFKIVCDRIRPLMAWSLPWRGSAGLTDPFAATPSWSPDTPPS